MNGILMPIAMAFMYQNMLSFTSQNFSKGDVPMGHIIAFANQKGGVGKSTMTVQGAFYYALKKGKKVLVVDMDAQANSTSTLLCGDELTSSRSEELFNKDLPDLRIQKTKFKGIDLIGSSLTDDAGYDAEALPIQLAGNPSEHLDKLRDRYDYIFLDCPPSLGRRLLSALLAADFVVSPVKLSGYAVEGLSRLFTTMLSVKQQFRPQLQILGIVINEFDGSVAHKKALQDVTDALDESFVFKAMLRHRSPVDTASHGLPVWKVRNGQKAAEEFADIFDELAEKIENSRVD